MPYRHHMHAASTRALRSTCVEKQERALPSWFEVRIVQFNKRTAGSDSRCAHQEHIDFVSMQAVLFNGAARSWWGQTHTLVRLQARLTED